MKIGIVSLPPIRGTHGSEDHVSVELCQLLSERGVECLTMSKDEYSLVAKSWKPDILVSLSLEIQPLEGTTNILWHFNESSDPTRARAMGFTKIFSNSHPLLPDCDSSLELASLRSCVREQNILACVREADILAPPLALVGYVGNLTREKRMDGTWKVLELFARMKALVLFGRGWDDVPSLRDSWKGPIDPSSDWESTMDQAAVWLNVPTARQAAMGCMNDRIFCTLASGRRIVTIGGRSLGVEGSSSCSVEEAEDFVMASISDEVEGSWMKLQDRINRVRSEHLYEHRLGCLTCL